jgi:hypothetical protein
MAKGNPNPNMKGLRPFKPGETGNPGGKPVNARNRVTAAFLKALADDFDENGKKAIEAARKDDPMGYVRAIVALLPKEFVIERPGEDLTDDQLAAIITELQGRVGALEGAATEPGGAEPADGVPSVH